jgi:gas vesicle protein
MAEKSSSGEVIMSFILGGLIGAAIGILYAPRSGKDTRKKLQQFGEDVSDKVENFGEEMRDKTQQIINESREKIMAQKERIEDAIECGRRAYEKK